MCYTKNVFPTEYLPTVFDNYLSTLTVGDKTVSMALWDTAGQEEFDSLRPLSYPGTDLFIICYSVASRSSFKNIGERVCNEYNLTYPSLTSSQWYPEVTNACPNALIMLVGTKIDLLESPEEIRKMEETNTKPVTLEEAEELANSLECVACLQCSALTKKNLKEVFQTAAECVLGDPNAQKAHANDNQTTTESGNKEEMEVTSSDGDKEEKGCKCVFL